MDNTKSLTLFNKAQTHIPGGVNSPVRAFKSVGGQPVFMESAQGAYMYDVDGNRYIDMINSWGPMILGHGHGLIEEAVKRAAAKSLSFGTPTASEVEMADLITQMVPGVDKVRMVNSGTEATMSAVRLARGFTGRDKMIKFEGCYHGHGDSFLIAAGSGAATLGVPDSPGVTKGTAQDTLTLPFNDLEALERTFDANKNEIAAVIIEPVVGNMGCVPPKPGYLEGIRDLCTNAGVVLIFDEVMTGFRLAPGGAQELFGITPDLTTMGKVIGGGMPVGAYGGKAEIMSHVAPEGPVYQAGTLSGNPIAMAAGLAMLRHLSDHREIYDQLTEVTQVMVDGIRKNVADLRLPYIVNHVGSMFSLFFSAEPVSDFEGAKKSDLTLFSKYFTGMLDKGVYLAPSQYETLFVSAAIDRSHAEHIVQCNYEVLRELHNQ